MTTPGTLLAVHAQLSDLYDELHKAQHEATNAPASELEAAREAADEANEAVLQYLSHVLGGAA